MKYYNKDCCSCDLCIYLETVGPWPVKVIIGLLIRC